MCPTMSTLDRKCAPPTIVQSRWWLEAANLAEEFKLESHLPGGHQHHQVTMKAQLANVITKVGHRVPALDGNLVRSIRQWLHHVERLARHVLVGFAGERERENQL